MKKTIILAMFGLMISAGNGNETSVSKKWSDMAELSYVQTSGNSKTATISAKNRFNYDWDKLGLEFVFGGLGAKSGGVVTAEQYNASEKVSLKLSGKNYTFEKVAWDKNRFAGIKDRFDISLGVGREFLNSDNDKLFGEFGGGYIFEDRLGSDNQSFGTYRAYAKYIKTLSPTASASQDAEYLGNLKDKNGYRINSETAIITSISTHFSLKASYILKYLNKPATGF